MKRFFIIGVLLCQSVLWGQVSTPSEFLGYTIGTEFSRHATMVDYFHHLAEQSNWVTYEQYGTTNERRPLTYAVISTPENLAKIESIKAQNLKQAGIKAGGGASDVAIVWLSYNVHGNEASSMEAAMQTAYELITSHQDWLQNTVVVMDPCVNPDGRDRYANWYNQVRARPYNSSQVADEHNEPWPGGRPNHYLFDLNRDWAWAKQVESQQRIALYNQWLPHVHVDFHEQGINEPYYFAPAAAPFHEVITPWQKAFQTQIGQNNARYFDQEGWLYFTRQFFDLLYPSYGDTYPTFTGAIGMTYEQAGHGRGGLGVDTDQGYELTLVDRVAHHTTTGLATVEISSQNVTQLNKEFRAFFERKDIPQQTYVLTGVQDKIKALTDLLDLHDIDYGFTNTKEVRGWSYQSQTNGTMSTQGGLVVSTNQPKGVLVKVLFEAEAALEEPLTYDITAWSLPYAFGLNCIVTEKTVALDGKMAPFTKNSAALNNTIAGYILPWNDVADGAFLSDLLQAKIKVRFAEKPLRFEGVDFAPGSLVITKSDNRSQSKFTAKVTALANKHERTLVTLSSGFSDNGIDLGSTNIKIINNQRVAILKGDGVSSLSYGTLWHFMEQELKYPFTALNTATFEPAQLRQFDVLVLPSGWYGSLFSGEALSAIKSWIRDGGKVIAIDRALNTFAGQDDFGLKRSVSNTTTHEDEPNMVPYGQRERHELKDMITGSIYKVRLDNTHPMAFGYPETYYSLKQGSAAFSRLNQGYNVGYFDGPAKSVSGFSGAAAQEGLANSLIFGEYPMGQGSLVYLSDDVLFRSFWENGKLFFVNSLFFVNANVFVLD